MAKKKKKTIKTMDPMEEQPPSENAPLLPKGVPDMGMSPEGSPRGAPDMGTPPKGDPTGDPTGVPDMGKKVASDATAKLVEARETESTGTTDYKGEKQTPDDIPDLQSSAAEKPKDKKKDKKSKQRKGVQITAASAFELEREVSKNMAKHNLANQYLAFRHFWFFTVPQAVLTCVSGILAFVATLDLLTNEVKTIVNTIVGSISGVVVFLQTMSGICNYGSRADMHQSAAIDLRDLRDDLHLLKQKLKQIEMDRNKKKSHAEANGEDHEDSNEEDGASFDEIQSRFRQSLSACKSNVPMGLTEAFAGIESNLLLARSKENNVYMTKIYGEIEFDDFVQSKAHDILAGEILHSRFFPFSLPKSKDVVQRTMERLRNHIELYQCFWHKNGKV
mmetsp:Transcript_5013/g.11634  ORF Transcript_5013/g.11634 Transcript_5013/m.11634 type:complete len:390 (-) Transcript_5013:182-1351(-)